MKRIIGTLVAMSTIAMPAAAQLVGGAVGGAGAAVGNVGAAAGSAVRAKPGVPMDAAQDAADRPTVRVRAGASVRVAEGTRCHYEDRYHDPVYRDGTWYCERTGPAAGAAAGVRASP